MPWVTHPNVAGVVQVSQAQFDLIYSGLGWTVTTAPSGSQQSLIERDVVFSDTAPIGRDVDTLWWDLTVDVLKRWDVNTSTWESGGGGSGLTAVDNGDGTVTLS
jgi:hypothetical protein